MHGRRFFNKNFNMRELKCRQKNSHSPKTPKTKTDASGFNCLTGDSFGSGKSLIGVPSRLSKQF